VCVLILNKNNGISESINNDQNSFILFQMVLKTMRYLQITMLENNLSVQEQ